jgi:hypothetical protein
LNTPQIAAQEQYSMAASWAWMDRKFNIQRAIESREAACLEAAKEAKSDSERQQWLLEGIAWHDIAGLVADRLRGVEEGSPPPLSPDLEDLDDPYYRRYYR